MITNIKDIPNSLEHSTATLPTLTDRVIIGVFLQVYLEPIVAHGKIDLGHTNWSD